MNEAPGMCCQATEGLALFSEDGSRPNGANTPPYRDETAKGWANRLSSDLAVSGSGHLLPRMDSMAV